ncbi:replication/maintenance protein RepL [Pantoea ananatis]|uniref:replication/maintenance protein RepL n=1 Tax=Pantoea ananas TaxID=553 RepID=UPI001B30FFDC|nr:replication/maintenance protein RepL [Pantoea ananatis]
MNNNTYDKNPFILQNGIEILTKDKRRTVARGEKFESPEGQRYESVINSIQEVDKEKFVKLFISKIRVIFDLSLTGNKLFYIFLFSISDAIGKDQVYMNFETAKDIANQRDFNLSNPVFYRGIKELIEKQIIAPSKSKYIYYINPAVVFNGDRARFIEEIKIKNGDKNAKK